VLQALQEAPEPIRVRFLLAGMGERREGIADRAAIG
jgi:hypothetical protein